MFEILKDAAKIGVGALWLSKENLKKLTDNLAEAGKASKEEGERLFKEMETAGEDHRKKLTEFIDTAVKKSLDKAGLATKAEVEDLKKKIAEMQAMMGSGS
ncbi:MAG: hypothetical protein HZB29_00255 [Nitrospinae bacterium]|nr:hypothetical protein [Nitrospinota bacterium]